MARPRRCLRGFLGGVVRADVPAGLLSSDALAHELGAAEQIGRRSVAFFLVKSAANFVAVAVLGTAMAVGLVGPHPSLWLTAGPAAAALLAMAAVAYTPRLGPGRELPLVVGGIAFASLRRGMNRRAELCAVPAAT